MPCSCSASLEDGILRHELVGHNFHLESWLVLWRAPGTKWISPWKINMEHNNGGLEDDFPFQIGDF